MAMLKFSLCQLLPTAINKDILESEPDPFRSFANITFHCLMHIRFQQVYIPKFAKRLQLLAVNSGIGVSLEYSETSEISVDIRATEFRYFGESP
jgi:hypothetical protein